MCVTCSGTGGRRSSMTGCVAQALPTKPIAWPRARGSCLILRRGCWHLRDLLFAADDADERSSNFEPVQPVGRQRVGMIVTMAGIHYPTGLDLIVLHDYLGACFGCMDERGAGKR